jgi:hypothetical protein
LWDAIDGSEQQQQDRDRLSQCLPGDEPIPNSKRPDEKAAVAAAAREFKIADTPPSGWVRHGTLRVSKRIAGTSATRGSA